MMKKRLLRNGILRNGIRFALLTMVMWLPSIALNAQESGSAVEAKVVDGKVIISKDGEVIREIDLGDHAGVQGFVLEQKSSSDGSGEAVQSGHAFLIGPDGTKKVILGEDGANFSFGLSDSPPNAEMLKGFLTQAGQNGFSIGVSCGEVEGAVKAHMNLSFGLVVNDVFDESAADEAGLQQFDILLTADGDELNQVQQLVEAIQKAGKAEGMVKLSLLREGSESEVVVTPRKNEVSKMVLSGLSELGVKDLQGFTFHADGPNGLEGLKMQRMLPGIIQSGVVGSNADMASEIAELRAMIELLREEMRNK